MNLLKRKRAFAEWLWTFFLLFVAAGIFLRPHTAAAGAAAGLSICADTLIPALFPFMILSSLLLESRFTDLLFFFDPYLKLLRIRSRKASAALLCGILGGFAPGAKAVDSLYRCGELSKKQAELMLICTVGAGPGFVVNGIGAMMLKNAGAGWLLFLSQLCAQGVCGIAASFLMRQKCPSVSFSAKAQCCASFGTAPKSESATAESTYHPKTSFTDVVRSSVQSVLMLCGTVTFFSFLTHLVTPSGANPRTRYFASVFLELTSACSAACESASPMRSVMCCAALSCMGACAFLQVRALVCPAVSLRPLILSRLFHLPCALLFFKIFSRCFPDALAAGADLCAKPLIAVRMPADVMIFLFLLCTLVCGVFPAHSSLRKYRKDV